MGAYYPRIFRQDSGKTDITFQSKTAVKQERKIWLRQEVLETRSEVSIGEPIQPIQPPKTANSFLLSKVKNEEEKNDPIFR